jgi:predicted MFS family arabinose efflux permease
MSTAPPALRPDLVAPGLAAAAAEPAHRRRGLVAVLGLVQILGWGASYYMPSVLAGDIARDTGWSTSAVVGGLSWGLLVTGLAAPAIGRRIDRRGGRSVLAAGSVVIAAGLVLVAAAHGLALYYAGWTVLGIGMAAALYDAVFATLGRLHGERARSSITGITLVAGLTSTVSWPVLAALGHGLGWRGACLALAALQVVVAAPAYALLVPPVAPQPARRPAPRARGRRPPLDRRFILLALAFTLHALVGTGLWMHLLPILKLRGLGTAAAIAFGMVIGPSQVASRLLEFLLGRRVHPVWTARAGSALVLAGLVGLLLAGASLAIVPALILYGCGNGILTIARGTLPMALFGAAGYGGRLGALARPALLAQAVSPVALAPLLAALGGDAVLGLAAALVAAALLAFLALRPTSRAP